MFRIGWRNRGAATLAALFCAAAMLLGASGLAAKPAKRPHGGAGRALEARGSDPRALLRQMLVAETRVRYSGREVTQFADGRQSEQIVKCDPKLGLRREFLRPDGDLYVDDLRHSWSLSMRRRRMYERASRLAEMRRSVQVAVGRIERGELSAHYDGRDMVAGREAHIVRLASADGAGRGSTRRYWIDAKTGLRLKTEEIGAQGSILSASYFVSLDLRPPLSRAEFQRPPVPPGVDFIREQRESFPSIREAQRRVPFALRAPGYLPPGFTLRIVHVTRSPGRPVMAAQRYTNGLSTFTLFQSDGELPQRSGGRAGGSQPPRVRTWSAGGSVFALIGGLPDDEMQRIAASIR